MTAAWKAALAVLAVALFSVGVLSWKLTTAQRKVQALELAPQKAATVTAAAKVETVTVRLAGAVVNVGRVIHDTIPVPARVLHPTTAADTQSAVAALPVVKAERDSIARTCSAFVVTCGEYRTAAEQRFRADSAYRVGLEAALRGASPSRLGAIWNRVKLPIALAGGIYLGSRLR